MSYDPVASFQCSLVELVVWQTSLALLLLMKRCSGDVVIIHGNPAERAPFTKQNHSKMEGKGSKHKLPYDEGGEILEWGKMGRSHI